MIGITEEKKYIVFTGALLLAIGSTALLLCGFMSLGILGLVITGPMGFYTNMIIQKEKENTNAYMFKWDNTSKQGN